jgi:hypothetical protein
MTDEEREYRDRSKRLYLAGMSETDPELQAALLNQSTRLAMKAIKLELERKQAVLRAFGIPVAV